METDRPADRNEAQAPDLIAELQAVRDAVEELYILLDHIWRNREELRDILADLIESGRVQAPGAFPLEDALDMGLTAEQIRAALDAGVTTTLGLRQIEKNTRAGALPETIACAHCDADSPASLAAAIQEGWTRLQRDDGAGWNYLGVCPECRAEEQPLPGHEHPATNERPLADEQGRLFG